MKNLSAWIAAYLLVIANPLNAETFANTLNGDAIKLATALTGGQAGLGNIANGALSELDQKFANAIATVRNGSIPKPITDVASKKIAQGESILNKIRGSV